MGKVEILRGPPTPHWFVAGPLMLAALFGLVALVPAPAAVRLGALALAMATAWATAYFALPAAWIALDDEGFTYRRRLGRPRRVAWAEVEAFEIGRTPAPPWMVRAAIFLPAFALAIVAGAGAGLEGDITDTSRPAIGWRRRDGRHGGWIIDACGLSQDALLARLRARLAASG